MAQPAPVTPPAQRSQLLGGALTMLFVLAVFGGLGLWAQDDLRAWLQPAARVQTSGLGECRAPAAGEQLVIVLGQRGERIVFKCRYLQSRGAAKSRFQGTVL